jgi:SAM-dependent methyltransferase
MTDEARRSAISPLDGDTPNVARMYDYYLGGTDNFPVDRAAAEEVLRVAPPIRPTALENRAFLGRAVRYLTGEARIRQFVDVGSGLPTRRNVHEVAHEIAPDARVAYVDNDPVVLAHSRALLVPASNAITLCGDLRDPAGIIGHHKLTGFIDWNQPVALLLVAILHFIADEDLSRILTSVRRAMAPGSHLVVSHIHHEGQGDVAAQVSATYDTASAPVIMRSRSQITELFDGFDLIEPGVVSLPDWRPDRATAGQPEIWGLGGIGMCA